MILGSQHLIDGGWPQLSNCMGGLDMEWSTYPHIQRVLQFWKKNLKKSLECIRIILYLWGGGWAWLSYIHI